MLRTLALSLAFALSLDAAPRTRATAHPPSALAITEEYTTADPVFGPSYDFEHSPRVAAGGGIGLVVWNGGVKAARLDANGRLLDPTPIAVLAQPFATITDVVFHDGAFTFAAAMYVPTNDPRDVLLVRVTPAGEVSTRLIGRTLNAFSAALATNGRELLVAMNTSEGIDTYFVAADGAVTLGPRLAGGALKLASNGTDFLALSRTGDAFAVTRIGRDGTAGEPAPIGFPQAHDLLWNGTDYVVLGLVTDVLRGLRVSAAGVPGEAFLEIPTAPGTQYPSFSWTGSEYRVLWKQRGTPSGTATTFDAWTARAGANGHVIESVRIRERSDTYGRRVSIGTTDVDGSLMAWTEFTEHLAGAVSNIVATTGTGMPVEVVSRRANNQYRSAAAQNGDATLIASVDLRRAIGDLGTSRISVARVRDDGTHTPGTILFPNRGAQDFPDLAWNGVDTWLVWRDTAGVFAARIDGNGTLLDREPIRITNSAQAWPQVACGPADCLVVWTDGTLGSPHVWSTRLAPNGTLLDAQPVDHGRGFVDEAVWADGDYAFTMSTGAACVLVRLRGGATQIASQTTFDSTLAWNGSEYLVVWRDSESIRFTRVGATGNVLAEPQSLGGGLYPSAVWTGRHFLVSWGNSPQVLGVRITRSGTIADRFPLSEPGNQGDPALAMRDDGTIVLTFTRYYDGWPYWNAERTLVRFARD